jgi:hypothetical protein
LLLFPEARVLEENGNIVVLVLGFTMQSFWIKEGNINEN